MKAFFEGVSEAEIEQEIQGSPGESQLSRWLKYTGYEIPQRYTVKSGGMEIGSIAEREEGWISLLSEKIIFKEPPPLPSDCQR